MLEKYGTVFAPDVTYHKDENTIEKLQVKYSSVDINTVIGSSIGGFAGYYISHALNKPALLFNPALRYRSVNQLIPKIKSSCDSFKHIVIGQRDDVNPTDTLHFIAAPQGGITNFQISLGMKCNIACTGNVLKKNLKFFLQNILLIH